MGRFQAIEFEDFKWFPATLRNFMTDVFHINMIRFDLYKCIMPLIKDAMAKTGQKAIIDLCSGGSGPLAQVQQTISDEYDYPVTVTLTDKYPNIPAFKRLEAESSGGVGHIEYSVDATDVPEDIDGFRTIFSAFHHFPPAVAVNILQDTVDKKSSIGIFELSNRTPSAFFQVLVGGPIGQLFMAPFMKPFSLLRLLLTYVPVIPILCMWDGTASNLRAYNPSELQQLISRVRNNQSYEWQTGVAKGEIPGIRITYLIATPKVESASQIQDLKACG